MQANYAPRIVSQFGANYNRAARPPASSHRHFDPGAPIMNSRQAQALRNLLETQQVASLGTLHQSEPYVSMVPFALLPRGRGLVIQVSQLATHTQDMLTHSAVSLLVVAPQHPEVPAQALARATIQGQARQCAETDPDQAEARRAYLSRFPQSLEMFHFSDFSLFVIVPRTVRFVGGFAQAATISAESLVDIMSDS